MHGELSHKRHLPYAGPGNRRVGIPVGQGTAQFLQRDRLQAARTRQGDERAYDINGHRTAVARRPRTDPVVHQHDCPRQEVPCYPGEHLVRRTSSPVLGVSGPADEGQPVFSCNVLGRRRHDTPRGPPEAHGSRRARLAPTPRRLRSPLASWSRGGCAPYSESLRRVLPPACGPEGKGSAWPAGPRRRTWRGHAHWPGRPVRAGSTPGRARRRR